MPARITQSGVALTGAAAGRDVPGRVLHGREPLLVLVEGAAQHLELVADFTAEALVEVLLAEQLVGELHGDQEGDALQAGGVGDPAPAREQLEVGVDVVGELRTIRALIAADGELLPGDSPT